MGSLSVKFGVERAGSRVKGVSWLGLFHAGFRV